MSNFRQIQEKYTGEIAKANEQSFLQIQTNSQLGEDELESLSSKLKLNEIDDKTFTQAKERIYKDKANQSYSEVKSQKKQLEDIFSKMADELEAITTQELTARTVLLTPTQSLSIPKALTPLQRACIQELFVEQQEINQNDILQQYEWIAKALKKITEAKINISLNNDLLETYKALDVMNTPEEGFPQIILQLPLIVDCFQIYCIAVDKTMAKKVCVDCENSRLYIIEETPTQTLDFWQDYYLHYFYNTLIATIHKGKINITFKEMWGFSIEELDIFNKTQQALSKLQDFMHQKAQQEQNMKQFN